MNAGTVSIEQLRSDAARDVVTKALGRRAGATPDLVALFDEQAKTALDALVDHFTDFGPREDDESGTCICTDADDPNDHRTDCPRWGAAS